MNWEFMILDFIAEHLRTDIGNIFFPFLSSLANRGMIWIIFSLLLLSQKRTRRIGFAALFSLILMQLIGNSCIKPLIARERPFIVRPEKLIYMLIPPPGEYSFPSGHTFSSFAAATVIALGNKKLGILALILATIIGFSRLYLYVHFPTDVLGGMLFGIILGAVVWHLLSDRQNHSKIQQS